MANHSATALTIAKAKSTKPNASSQCSRLRACSSADAARSTDAGFVLPVVRLAGALDVDFDAAALRELFVVVERAVDRDVEGFEGFDREAIESNLVLEHPLSLDFRPICPNAGPSH